MSNVVSRGRKDNHLLLTACDSVDMAGLPRHACAHLTNSASIMLRTTALTPFVLLVVLGVVVVDTSGATGRMVHKSSFGRLEPEATMWPPTVVVVPPCVIMTSCWVNTAVQP